MVNITSHYRNIKPQNQWYQRENNLAFLSSQREYYTRSFCISEKVILDVGCGSGAISEIFLTGKNMVVGVDLSLSTIKEASRKGVKAVVSDIETGLPFKDGCFDCVIITEVLEHLFDPIDLLKEIHRILRDNGLLICSLPNNGNLLNRLHFLLTGILRDFTASGCTLPGGNHIFTEHLRIFSPKVIKYILKRQGFCILKMDYWFPDYSAVRRFKWIAGMVSRLKLYKIFPGLLAINMRILAQKKS